MRGRVTEDVTDNITHLITTSPKGSLKLFCSLAIGGIWILQPNFIYDSASEGNWVSEISREWSEDYLPDGSFEMKFVKAIKRRREENFKAFKDWKIGFEIKNEISVLVEVGGGNLIDLSVEDEIETMTHLYVENKIKSQLASQIENWRKLNPNFKIVKKTEIMTHLTKNLKL